MDQFGPQGVNNPGAQPSRDFSGLKPPESMTSGTPRPTPGQSPLKFPQASNTPPQAPRAVPSPSPTMPTGVPTSPPRSSFSTIILIFILLIILVAAILVFISWKGWISLGGIEKLWGGGKTTPTPGISVTLETATPTPESFDAQRKKDLATLKSSLKNYFADNSKYPEQETPIKTSDSSSVLAQDLVPAYIAALPDDPLAPKYYYSYKSDGQVFELSCVLEDMTDTSGRILGNLNIYILTDTSGE